MPLSDPTKERIYPRLLVADDGKPQEIRWVEESRFQDWSVKMDKTAAVLTQEQLRAIPYLPRAASFEEGCRRGRISRKTVSLWLRDETFVNELRCQREQLMTVALEALGASAAKASAVLVGLLQSSKDHVRLKAAETIVRLARRSTPQESVKKRNQIQEANDERDLSELLTPEQIERIDFALRMNSAAGIK
jgi:hypothetical protein